MECSVCRAAVHSLSVQLAHPLRILDGSGSSSRCLFCRFLNRDVQCDWYQLEITQFSITLSWEALIWWSLGHTVSEMEGILENGSGLLSPARKACGTGRHLADACWLQTMTWSFEHQFWILCHLSFPLYKNSWPNHCSMDKMALEILSIWNIRVLLVWLQTQETWPKHPKTKELHNATQLKGLDNSFVPLITSILS